MIIDKFEIILSLVSGLIITLMGFINKTPLKELVIKLLIVMAVFLLVGYFIKLFVLRKVFRGTPPVDNDEKEDGNEI